jgi:hypothetical protein
MNDVIPIAVSRRLILALLGFTFVGGEWWLGHEHVSEEKLDTLSERQWRAFLRRWSASVAATN